jgi:periplasmic protein TonB
MKIKQLTLLLLAFSAFGLCARAEDFEKPDDPPVPVRTPPPKYPTELKREGVSGMVVVNMVIDTDGSVQEVTVSKSTHIEFERPAIDAVKGWKFKPAKKDGAAIRSRVALPLKFTVD